MKFRDYLKESFGTAAAVAMTIMAGGGKKGGVPLDDIDNAVIKKNQDEIKDLQFWIKNHQQKYMKGDFDPEVKKRAKDAIDFWEMQIRTFQKEIDRRVEAIKERKAKK
jgi:hypothetical protein